VEKFGGFPTNLEAGDGHTAVRIAYIDYRSIATYTYLLDLFTGSTPTLYPLADPARVKLEVNGLCSNASIVLVQA